MNISGTLINAYFICRRKVWLFAHEILPDPSSDLLEIGRLITEESFIRDRKEILIEGLKIDILKRRGREFLVGEIKKSSAGIEAAKMQLAFYLLRLKRMGLQLKGEILIPREKKRIPLLLSPELENDLREAIKGIRKIMSLDVPPPPLKSKFCRRCVYREFCWA